MQYEQLNTLVASLEAHYRLDEAKAIQGLIKDAKLSVADQKIVQERAINWVGQIRDKRLKSSGLDAFLGQYDLSSEEGIVLMCLAESLLRIPDKETANRLIEDKLSFANWQAHAGKSHSTFVNAGTYGLMLTGKILRGGASEHWGAVLKRLAKKMSEPVIREALLAGVKILGQQFVMGETIEEGLKRAAKAPRGYRHSFDMLGEAAKTEEDAIAYFHAYQHAIDAVAAANVGRGPIEGSGVSVKLSALHPRYEPLKAQRVKDELRLRLVALVQQAAKGNIGLTVDAEESDRLMLSLSLIESVMADVAALKWEGFGVAVQAYQKRAPYVIDYLATLAKQHGCKIMVRLVKGAYWDSEIKWTQERGLSDYPVYTRKVATDVSYLACAKKLFSYSDVIYPQFATHNAYTAAAILSFAQGSKAFEFQGLHGMEGPLYDTILADQSVGVGCRVYAPVGGYENLLAYLVRRLLENGANTSFVNRILEESVPLESLVADPVLTWEKLISKRHKGIPVPRVMYGTYRQNSVGVDFSHVPETQAILSEIDNVFSKPLKVTGSLGSAPDAIFETRMNPSRQTEVVAEVALTTLSQVTTAAERAHAAYPAWSALSMHERTDLILRAAELLQENQALFLGLLVKEGGKILPDAVAELREAIDYCYYYSALAKREFAEPITLPGPTGETNSLYHVGRGVIFCVSPWNFPLAIFLGQVLAALVTGNTVIAKPASQTPVIAVKAIELLHKAGVPKDVVQVLPGKASVVGETLTQDPRISGVILTGGTDTARHINQVLANRPGPLVPFIAETGGQNAMIVDSSALAEQVVNDVMISAFMSAGQRCSALRVLFLQKEIAPRILKMLKGAMLECQIGASEQLSTDVGPVIDANAKKALMEHVNWLDQNAALIARVPMPAGLPEGHYFAPCAYLIDSISQLKQENFGPILHVVTYAASDLEKVVESINATGFGLTLGIQSRIDSTVEFIRARARVGNVYVNRTQIGAVVGTQPFGGEGLSGTGPKAGGPHYLSRLVLERTFTVNTTAAGGNASLMTLVE